MRRRDFLALSGVGLAPSLTGCWSLSSQPPRPDEDIFAQLVRQNDSSVTRQLEQQERTPTHPNVGGVANRLGLYHPGSASGIIRNCASAYATEDSRYYQSTDLLDAMQLAADFLLRKQHADGTIDLLTTNFHSPPDTAFVLEWVCGGTTVLTTATDRTLVEQAQRKQVLQTLRKFISRAAEALVVGGIHTANHRWVVCMALARCHALMPDPRYVARIDEWLAEGIDIDPDGQFSERSTTVYSPITDRCLITIARLLDRKELLEHVRRNLAMTLFYLHPNGEVVTEASRRQDQYQRATAARYYFAYRYMAQMDQDGRFAAVARSIESAEHQKLTANLFRFLEIPSLRGPLPPPQEPPTNYERRFAHSDLVRIRRGAWSTTILGDNATFLTVQRGNAAVAVRFASAFFGKAQFLGAELRKAGDAWTMTQRLTGPYYQPAPRTLLDASGGFKPSRPKRRQSEVQHLESVVRVRERRDGFELEIEITGTDHVPVALELNVGTDGDLTGTHPVEGQPAGEAHLLSSGEATVRIGGDELRFGPGCATHSWTQIRGALPKIPGRSVYLTGATPFRHSIRFR